MLCPEDRRPLPGGAVQKTVVRIYWYTSMPVYRYNAVYQIPEYWYTGIPLYQYTGTPVYWYTGLAEYYHIGIQV